MFHYLDSPTIPKTTSAVEGLFGRGKERYHDDWGPAPHRLANPFRWYLHALKEKSITTS